MKHLTLALITAALLTAPQAWGVRASKAVQTHRQPDGTEVQYLTYGDERANMFTTLDGRPLVWEGETLCYGTVDEQGEFVSTRQPVGLTSVNSGRAVVAPLQLATLQNAAMARSARTNAWKGRFPDNTFPAFGRQHILVVLVQFKDRKFSTTYATGGAAGYFKGVLTQDGYSQYNSCGSAHQWFYESSHGQFDPVIDVYGPITLKNNSSYYAANDDLNADEMASEACDQLDPGVDFSQYDCDKDGVIDNCYVIFAGKGRNDGGGNSAVWPLSSEVWEKNYYDGCLLKSFACSNERTGASTPCGIGTFCHEFGHVMGLPDLYYTGTSSATFPTPDEWSIMDYGSYNNDGRQPPYHSAWECAALGWLDPTVIDSDLDVSMTHRVDDNQAFMYKTEKADECFIFENRQQRGFDASLPGHGMLIWHIDYLASVWTNNAVNNTSSHQRVDLVEADGQATGRAKASDPWPGTRNVTSFTSTTTPALKSWAGKAVGLPITEIAEKDGVITFKAGQGGKSGIADITTSAAATEVARYDMQGREVDASYRGLVIIRHSDGTATKALAL